MTLQLSDQRFATRLKNFLLNDLAGLLVVSAVPAALLVVYSLTCSLILPRGVNAAFSDRVWKIFSWYMLLPLTVSAVCLLLKKDLSQVWTKKTESFEPADFVFILVPMTPVVQYILSNQDSLNITSSALVFIVFSAVTAVSGVIIPVLLSRFAPKRMLITAATGFIYMIMSMAALSAANGWSGKGLLATQLIILGAVLLILSLQKLIPKNLFIAAIIIFFTVNTLSGLLFRQPSGGMPGKVKELSIVPVMEGMKIKKQNDILFIVYEGYANFETMKYYGFDNSEQAGYLEARGFKIYNGTYSIGAPTEQSLSKIFNIDRDIPDHKKYLAGSGAVHGLLGAQGYKTYGIFDNSWILRGLPIEQIRYDMTFPRASGVMDTRVLVNAIMTGEFSDAVSFEGVDYESYVKQKLKVISREYATPVFMYSHSGYPGHGPSGMGMKLEERDARVKKYIEGVRKANDEMRRDVEAVIKANPGAVVILAGDHGPFLTKTGYGLSKGRGEFKAGDIDRYDVQDRFGAFLAIRWPEKNYAERYDIKILQDIFPAVFAYLYGDDSLFDRTRIERTTKENFRTLGVYVKDGTVYGGRDNGQPLFIMQK